MQPIILFGKSKNGKIKEWSVSVNKSEEGHALMTIKHGFIDGKKQISVRKIEAGKNIGKKNETTPFEQACAEAKSLAEKKIDDNYASSIGSIPKKDAGFFLPMLAHRFDKHSKKIKYPAWIQPKLDGVRMLSKKIDGTIFMWSRKGKIIDVPGKIKSQLNLLMKDGDFLDGEIYVHGWDFQRIVSAVKKKNEDTDLLEYHIYDSPHINKDFESRFLNNKILINSYIYDKIIPVETSVVDSKDKLDIMENFYVVQNNYEGVMVRNSNSLYVYKDRSYDLQKVKRFEDHEFEIIGGKDGTGRESGLVIFKCITEGGVTFDVRPRGSHEDRAKIFLNLSDYLGKKLKVSYQGLTLDGVPRFPVGIGIRESWD